MPTTSIFLVEDHPFLREMLTAYFAGTSEIKLCGCAGTARQAIIEVPESGADVVLMDVSLPDMSGLDAVRELLKTSPDLKCIMLSGHTEQAYVAKALEVGARGYILKGNPSEISRAVDHVVRGDVYLSEPIEPIDSRELTWRDR